METKEMNEMPEQERAAIQERLSLTEEELLAAIGGDLVGPQALPLSPAELVERASRWLQVQRDRIETIICESETLQRFVIDDSDHYAIVIEITKLLAGLTLPVNPATLAVLLFKKGVKTLCAQRWESKEHGQES
jgi:hypothetical protein